jgi:hypothetical protein
MITVRLLLAKRPLLEEVRQVAGDALPEGLELEPAGEGLAPRALQDLLLNIKVLTARGENQFL